jgi:hypothetical protein
MTAVRSIIQASRAARREQPTAKPHPLAGTRLMQN